MLLRKLSIHSLAVDNLSRGIFYFKKKIVSTPLGHSTALCRASIEDTARQSEADSLILPYTVLLSEEGRRFLLEERATATGSTTAHRSDE